LGGKEGYNGSSQKGKRPWKQPPRDWKKKPPRQAVQQNLSGKSGGKLPFRLEISLEINRNSMLLRKNYSL